MRFARSLAKLRKEKKVSQRTAAAALGVSQALLSHYENGLREPGLEFLVNAGKYYECSVDRLLGIELPEKNTAPASATSAAKAVAEFAAGQSEQLGELADEYMMLAACRLALFLQKGGTDVLTAADAALRADELAICTAVQSTAVGEAPESLRAFCEKMTGRMLSER